MNAKATEAQLAYLLRLVNQVHGTSYYLSQVQEDGIGKSAMKVQGLQKADASALIDKYAALAKRGK